VGEVTNVDSEESVKRKFVKQKKIYRKYTGNKRGVETPLPTH
jgi:hypothetical protein